MIRPATIEDLATIVEIYNAAIPDRMATADLEAVTIESRRPWFDSHQADRYPLLVFDLDGRVAGWLSLRPFYGRAAYDRTVEVSLYVALGDRRQKIGRQLLDYAIASRTKLNLKNFVAFIFAHNQPSLKLFKRLDFVQWGYLPGIAELNGVERDLVILGRSLAE
jgi:L-amino acid N-acyltransferase YncA